MKKLMAVFFLIIIVFQYSRSQSDTIIVSEEQVDRSDEKYDRVYKLFIEDRDREINHLWKLDLIGFSLLMPNIEFEQKIGKSWSSDTYLSGGAMGYYSIGYGFESFFLSYYGIGLSQQFRYYHNHKRRERLGKRTNGFIGNYFGFSLNASFINQEPIWISTDASMDYYSSYGAGIRYGLQRRIGNIGYFECFAGLDIITSPSGVYSHGFYGIPQLGIKAGFAIDSFKNLKRMLK